VSAQTLHQEIEELGRAIDRIVRHDAGDPPLDSDSEAPDTDAIDEVTKGLGRLLAGKLPVDLRRRFDRIRKKLKARNPEAPRRDVAREIGELIDPLLRAGWAEDLLGQSLEALPGVGSKRSDGFARRGLERISDLLFWLPTRYEDRRRVSTVGDLVVGQNATFLAEVKIVDWVTTRRGGRFGKIFQAVVGDDDAVVTLKWFRGGEALANQVVKGRWLLVSGDVKRYRFSKELLHPEVEVIPDPHAAEDPGTKSATRDGVETRVADA
jgi:hypothetical protein